MRWGRILAGIGVVVFLAVPCLVGAIVVMAGGTGSSANTRSR